MNENSDDIFFSFAMQLWHDRKLHKSVTLLTWFPFSALWLGRQLVSVTLMSKHKQYRSLLHSLLSGRFNFCFQMWYQMSAKRYECSPCTFPWLRSQPKLQWQGQPHGQLHTGLSSSCWQSVPGKSHEKLLPLIHPPSFLPQRVDSLLWVELCPLPLIHTLQSWPLVPQNEALLETGPLQMELVEMRSHWNRVSL